MYVPLKCVFMLKRLVTALLMRMWRKPSQFVPEIMSQQREVVSCSLYTMRDNTRWNRAMKEQNAQLFCFDFRVKEILRHGLYDLFMQFTLGLCKNPGPLFIISHHIFFYCDQWQLVNTCFCFFFTSKVTLKVQLQKGPHYLQLTALPGPSSPLLRAPWPCWRKSSADTEVTSADEDRL